MMSSRWAPAIGWLAMLTLFVVPLAAQDEQAASRLAETATNAQNDGTFDFAASKWDELIEQHPKSTLLPQANLNAGICYVQLADFEKAVVRLQTAIPGLKDTEVQVPKAKMFLGYSQLQRGDALASGSDADAAEQSNQWWTTATETLGELLDSHPDYGSADQASFFRAQSFERLERLEDALAAYQRTLEFPRSEPQFGFDALFAIGDLQDRLGKPADARQTFARFREAAEERGGHPLLNDVNYQDAVTAIRLAQAREKQDQLDEAKALYREAAALLEQLAKATPPEGAAADSLFTPADAKFRQAYCLNRLQDYQAAAEIYVSLVDEPEFPEADQSLALAGSNYLAAGLNDAASDALKLSVETDSPYALDSAHLLAGMLLKAEQYEDVYQLAKRMLPRASKESQIVDLKMDLADAAFGIPGKQEEALQQFSEIATQHPQHSLAPAALYNVAFTSLELDRPADAIQAAQRFVQQFSDSNYLSDTLAVQAEAELVQKQYDAAAVTFETLAGDPQFSDDQRRPFWLLRSGLALYLNEDYDGAVQRLTPVAEQLEGNQRAEAYHWIGISQVMKEAFPEAIAALQASLDAADQWVRSDETLAYLCRAQLSQGDEVAARATAAKLVDQFPESNWRSDVDYRLGTADLDAGRFAAALQRFEAVLASGPETPQRPAALYSAAFCQLELKEYDAAEAWFSQLIEQYPENPLVKNARLQRVSIQRINGNADDSMGELKAMLETDLSEADRISAQYELGLAQVAAKQWTDAIATFESLLELATEDDRRDRFQYELAWANREADRDARAIEVFEQIVKQHPDSEFAPEAWFHLGNSAYDAGEFDDAIAAFAACVSSDGEAIVREKAAYKRAWASYKQEQYAAAEQAFAEQVQTFPEGDLKADGLFMLAESLFRQKKYEEAYQAYVVAQPAVNASEVVEPKLRWLTMLHGAQAANQSKQYQAALDLAGSIDDTAADEAIKQDVYLELGTACSGLKQTDEAMAYWKRATNSRSKTGARAFCLIGDQYFREKKFSEATDQFKEVFFGFGGREAAEDIQPWQAYALYETARCSYVQIKDAEDQRKPKLIEDAIKYFERLREDYPEDRLAEEAGRQLKTLQQARRQLNQE